MGEKNSSKGELPRYHKRAFAHNYKAPFIYHLIFKKQEACEAFGVVSGDARIAPGNPGCAFIDESALGHLLAKMIYRLQITFPFFQVYQYVVMPDHAHVLLRVKEWLEYDLDYYMDWFMEDVAAKYCRIIGREIDKDYIFVPGFCDKPLLLKRSLDGLYIYIRENPHRLAMRQQFPQFFQRTRNLKIGEKEFEAYGNLFLFRNPDKEPVKISRKFTQEEVEKRRSMWLSGATEGTILVSPFISKAEKEIRAKAEEVGGKIILITHEAFGERYKPSAHDFNLCSEGRLLIISIGYPEKTPISREICEEMNQLAVRICEEI